MAKKKVTVPLKKTKVQGDPGYWRQQHVWIAKRHKAAARLRESSIARKRREQENMKRRFS